MTTSVQYKKIDQTELLKADCIDIAKQSWLINQHPPFIVGFKGEENFPLLLPGFTATNDVLDSFIEIVSENEDWDAIAVYTSNGNREFRIKLIMPDKILTATADIIDDYGMIKLNNFSEWQEGKNEKVTLAGCINRDLGNAYKRRLNCG